MADIQLRFHKDMLVLSSPVVAQLERLGVDTERDNELTVLLEPEVLEEVYALEATAGAQCIVTDTAFMTPARLAKVRMGARGADLAESALRIVRSNEYGSEPQHVLVEIGPCGLPLDAASKESLNENRDQYSRAAKFFTALEPLFDAYFLNGFEKCADLKCALMGMRKVTDKPIFASVRLGVANGAASPAVTLSPSAADYTLGGKGRETLADAIAVMAEYGAQVAGFETDAPIGVVTQMVREAQHGAFLPLLVQLAVREINPEQNAPIAENPYYEPDTMVDAADALKAAGVQFLRATGMATPSYTGALVAATLGDSVNLPERVASNSPVEIDQAELDDLAARLRARINDALGN